MLTAIRQFAVAAVAASSLLASDVAPDGGLGFVAERVRQHQPVRAVWMGGSITQGSGASTHARSYWWLSSRRLIDAGKQRGSTVTAQLAAAPGTNSAYGAFRFAPQILAAGTPDLLVLEFTVNDGSNPQAAESLEGIVRQVRRANPKAAVVVFSTTARKQLEERAGGGTPASLAAHARVAAHYRLPHLDAGPAVAELERAGTPMATLLPDGVHPADAVHARYAELLGDLLTAALDRPAPAAPEALPAPLVSDEYAWARLEPLPTGQPGWEVAKPGYYTYLGTWTATTPDAVLELPVRPGRVGLCFLRLSDAEITLPGAAPRRVANQGRADGVPTLWLPAAGATAAGTMRVQVACPADRTPEVRLAGLARILPPEERR